MREILLKLIEKGLTVVLSEEAGVPVIRLYKGNVSEGVLVNTCRLGAGTFRETIEDALNSMLLEIDRH